jgi:hypothetical protein
MGLGAWRIARHDRTCMSSHFSFLTCLVISASLSASLGATESEAFEISGRIESIWLPAAGNGRTNSRTFLMAMDGQKLFIRCSAGTADRGIEYTEFGSDGTSGFHMTKFLQATNPSARRGSDNDSTMSIEPSPVPPQGSGSIEQVWLVYSAHRELSRRTDPFIRPFAYVSLRETPFDQELWGFLSDNLLLRAEWTFHVQTPHLLATFVDYRDGRIGRHRNAVLPDELMTGKTNSRMDVLTWTNLAGLSIPVESLATIYTGNTNRPGGPLEVQFSHRLLATSIVARTTRREFLPKAAQATRVVDWRFAQGQHQPAVYISTNGVIFGTWDEAWAEVQRQEDEASRRRKARLDRNGVK